MKAQRKRNKQSNREKIRDYLLLGNSLTRVMASTMQMGMDLSTRISELRAEGMIIDDEYVDGKKLQKRYIMSGESIAKYKQSTKGE